MKNITQPDSLAKHPVTGKQLLTNFWDNTDMSKKLFNRFYDLSKFHNLGLMDLSEGSGISKGPGVNVNRINWIVMSHSPKPGPNIIKNIHEARITINQFNNLQNYARGNHIKVTDDDMASHGLDEKAYAMTLRKVSEFFAWAYDLPVDERIRNIYKDVEEEDGDEIPRSELDRINKDDLENKSYRFDFIIIIDDSLSMGENNKLLTLQQNLANLVHEIERSSELSRRIELYVATCGGKPKEIVDFAMIERQMLQLSMLILKPFGPCRMAEAIEMALNKLKARLETLSDPSCDIKYYRPWMLILSDGKFKGDMEGAINRIRQEFDFLQVYARGVSEEANMDNLRKLDKGAAILDNLDGFFKDVFVSLRKVKDSIPGGERIHLVNELGFTKKQ